MQPEDPTDPQRSMVKRRNSTGKIGDRKSRSTSSRDRLIGNGYIEYRDTNFQP